MKRLALACMFLVACGRKPAPVYSDSLQPQYAPNPIHQAPEPQYVPPAPAPQVVQQPVVVREHSNDGMFWYMMGRATAPRETQHVYHAPPPVYHAPSPVVHRTTTIYRSAPARQAPRVAPRPASRPAPSSTKPFRIYKR